MRHSQIQPSDVLPSVSYNHVVHPIKTCQRETPSFKEQKPSFKEQIRGVVKRMLGKS